MYGKTNLVRVKKDLASLRADFKAQTTDGSGGMPVTQPTPSVLAAKGYVLPLRANVTQLRYWADTNEWIRAAIDHRCNQVGHTDWDIVPIEPGEEFDVDLKVRVLTALVFPNIRKDSFRSLMALVTQDLMVLDAGVVEKQLTVRGEPMGMVAVDGGTIRIFPEWNGTDPKAPHYAWMPLNAWKASFTNDQMIYIMARPSTHRLYGLSPLEILKDTIEAEVNSAIYNKRMVQQAGPSGIINLGENVTREQAAAFRVYFESEIAGRRGTGIMSGAKNPQFIRWEQSNRDMQYQSWQIYLVRKICHSEDTETLTENGWKHYWEIAASERIATYNPDTGHMEFHVPVEKMVFDYAGDMIRFSHKHVDVLVTPEHQMYYKTLCSWETRTAADLAKLCGFWIKQSASVADMAAQQLEIPAVEYCAAVLSGKPALADLPLVFDDVPFARFLGYFLSEGSLSNGRDHNIYQISLTQKEGSVCEDMRAVLRQLGLPFHENSSEASGCHLQVYHKALWRWLDEHCGHYSRERHIPIAIKNWRREALLALHETLMAGDGNEMHAASGRTRWLYFTISEQLADDVQEIATRIGYRAVSRYSKDMVGWRISICQRDQSRLERKDVSHVPYRGKVYCFDVPPNHLFFTRRNGKVAITGNCAVFGMNAQDIGMTMEMNRSTSEVAADISEDSGLRPLLSLIEEYINREFVADFQQIQAAKQVKCGAWSEVEYRRAMACQMLNPRLDEHRKAFNEIRRSTKALEEAAFLNLMFRYNLPTGRSLEAEADYAQRALGGLPWNTIDEIRKRQNLDPVPGGGEIVVMTPVGAIPLAMLVGSAPPQTAAQKQVLDALFASPALRLSGLE